MDDDDNNNNDHGFGPPPSLQLLPHFGLPLYNHPSPSISEGDNNEIEKDLTPAQKFLLGGTANAQVVFAEKLRFSEKLKKLFLKADAVFENNNQKLMMRSLLAELK